MRVIIVYFILSLPLVCYGGEKEKQSRLTNTSPSVHSIAERVLTLLAKNDFNGLEKLCMTEKEFKTIIWPELPRGSLEPTCGKVCDWCWRDLNQKSILSLRVTLSRFGGEGLQNYKLMKVKFAGETTEYRTFKIHRDARLVMRDEAGEKKSLKLFGSILEIDNQFKIMSFVAKY